ncbi:MAG: alpha/beta fold hydrolase [Leptolyngbya sp. LCM1.Bin17]|nr:MAG: alpha/beta fold hydrolase [Leptolyngbya sp. LCM1.Bin17]
MATADFPEFRPPWYLKHGLVMTLYVDQVARRTWSNSLDVPPVPYQDHIFTGQAGVPLFGRWAAPTQAKGTIIATYGITGNIDNQWFLHILGRKAYQRGYGVVLFDWRAHGKTADLSPTLTSDGIYEGEDYLALAAAAKALGCPPPYWFMGYSLSGQLALWAGKAAMALTAESPLSPADIGGVAVLCPSLDSIRSLQYLMAHPTGRYLERAIAKALNRLAQRLYRAHPDHFDLAAIQRANSIWAFDHELVIPRLGFASVEDYYAASSPLPFMADLTVPTLVLYAADDPLFAPDIVPDLAAIAQANPNLELILTPYGGHVGYYSSVAGRALAQDPDPWWAWNRVLDWVEGGREA